MSKNKKSLISLFFGFLLVLIAAYFSAILLAPEPASAQLLSNACIETGNCRFCDIISVATRFGRWLIAGAGGLALVIIVWAGIGMATAGGNPEKITAAKKQIVGAFFGVGITLIAFQLVSLTIFMLVVPSSSQTFAGGATQDAADKAGLKDFLKVPWWSICNEKDLIAKNGAALPPSTANCAYWGNGTQCRKNDDATCCYGVCKTGECLPPAKTEVQTIQDDVIVEVQPAVPAGLKELNINNDAAVRNFLASNGIVIDKSACQVPREDAPYCTNESCCYGATVSNSPCKSGVRGACTSQICTRDGGRVGLCVMSIVKGGGIQNNGKPIAPTCPDCVRLAGLPKTTIGKLIQIKKRCGNKCINITGGTEPGHSSHGIGLNVVDVAYTDGLKKILDIVVNGKTIFGIAETGNKNFTVGYTCEKGAGRIENCEVATWLHLIFNSDPSLEN